jgi:hypothetical protein
MNDGIHHSLAQCDFNVGFTPTNTVAMRDQLHELFDKRRDGSNLAWQRELECEGDLD